MRRTPLTAILTLVAVLASTVAVAGCGGKNGGSSTTTTTTSPTTTTTTTTTTTKKHKSNPEY